MTYIPTPDQFPKLSPEEEKLSMAKYYHRPLPHLDPVYEMAMKSCQLTQAEFPLPENWIDLLTDAEAGYNGTEFGYGMMADGAGYLSVYTVSHHPDEMGDWWGQWMGTPPKSMPEGKGNICYKLWCPPDHFDANHQRGGGRESLDLGQGDPMEDIYNFPLDPMDYGMTAEKAAELAAKDIRFHLGYEKFDHAGTHLCLRINRPCPTGGRESIGREWLGYAPLDGKFVRDADTPVSEEYLRKIVIHNVVESQRLEALLPELYAEYKDQPLDCD
jgi:hypothetical protein